jgi:hypothetical protein
MSLYRLIPPIHETKNKRMYGVQSYPLRDKNSASQEVGDFMYCSVSSSAAMTVSAFSVLCAPPLAPAPCSPMPRSSSETLSALPQGKRTAFARSNSSVPVTF